MGKQKQYRRVRSKEGQIKMQYGRDEDGELGNCLVYGGGEGNNNARRCDIMLVYNTLTSFYPEKDVFQELEKRGYDLTTLKFSIEKKKDYKNE
jgi:hypothetical protein